MGGREDQLGEKGQEDPLREALPLREEGRPMQSRRCYAVAKPNAAAKLSGTPNRRIVTGPAVRERALRASRSCHESRELRPLRTRQGHRCGI